MKKSQRQIENEQKRRKWEKHIAGWKESIKRDGHEYMHNLFIAP